MAQTGNTQVFMDKDLEAGGKGLKDSARVVVTDAVEDRSTMILNRGPCQLGNPGPAGLFAFGMTTIMLSFYLTTWSEATFAHLLFGYACFFGGLTQWLAGIFELIVGNTFGATLFLGYGSFYFGWWLFQIFTATGDFAGPAFSTGLALFYGLWAMFTLLLMTLVIKKNVGLPLALGLLFCTFAILCGSPWNVSAQKAGGYFAFITGVVVCYAAYGELFHMEYKIKLPLL